jgi:hypothetical protein
MSDKPQSKAERIKLERALRNLNKARHASSLEIDVLREAVRAAERTFHEWVNKKNRLDLDSRKLQQQLRDMIGPVAPSAEKPACWCCSCIHQSAKQEGCKACWLRDDVQQWIDKKDGLIHQDHGVGFLCPPTDRPQCPGWEPNPE